MFEIYPQNKCKQTVVKENIESSRVFLFVELKIPKSINYLTNMCPSI
jgi:hypothetical protein